MVVARLRTATIMTRKTAAGIVMAVAPSPSRQAPQRAFGGPAYYPNCAAEHAAGAAPLSRGDPGYASHLDRDNDGIACEPYRGR